MILYFTKLQDFRIKNQSIGKEKAAFRKNMPQFSEFCANFTPVNEINEKNYLLYNMRFCFVEYAAGKSITSSRERIED